jgi:hypothetical protein
MLQYGGASIAGLASALGKRVVNIDRDLSLVDWDKELCIDMDKYASYRNKYIKIDGSSEKSIWDVVIDYIENPKEKLSSS